MAWSIRSKLMLSQAIILAAFVVFVAWQLDRAISGLSQSFERLSATEDMNRVLYAFGQEAETLTRQARDYAAWDDTCTFITDGNQAYVDANLSDAMFAANAIDLLFLFALDGTAKWGKTLAPPQRAPMTLSEFALGRRAEGDPLMTSREGKPVTGLYRSSRGPLLVAAQPIVSSHYQGPAHGVLVMGRFVTDDLVQRIGTRTRVAVAAARIDEIALEDGRRQALYALDAGERILIDAGSSHHLTARSMIRDVEGRPLLLIEATIPRHVAAASRLALRAALLATLVAGLLIIILTFFSLSRLVLRPMAFLNAIIDRHEGRPRTGGIPILSGEFGELQRRLERVLGVRSDRPK